MISPEGKVRPGLAAAGFVLLFGAALLLDRPVAQWVRESGMGAAVKGAGWAAVVKEPGEFRLACAVAVVLVTSRVLDWRRGVFIGLAGVMGIVNNLLKWIVGRHRPYTFRLEAIDQVVPWNVLPFRLGVPLGKLTSNLSFGSGHAAASFATATALAILLPRWRWVFYGIATLTAIERVLENAHWCSDVVAGAGLSIFGVHLLWKWAQRPIIRPVGTGEIA